MSFSSACALLSSSPWPGRGVDVPMLAVLVGAIGGMVLSGIIGIIIETFNRTAGLIIAGYV